MLVKRSIVYNYQLAISLLVILFFINACAPGHFKTIPKLERRGETQKLLLMPMDIQLSILTAGGVLEPEAEWTENATEYVKKAVREQMNRMNTDILYESDIEEIVLRPEEKEKRLQLIKLHETVGHSILLHQYNAYYQLPSKHGSSDWSLGPECKFLKDKYGTDYALFVFLRDSYASGGRVAFAIAAAICGVGVPMGQQVGFASLVDLSTGQVVWFNLLVRGAGDLRTQEAAENSVKLLLSDFPK